MTDWESIYTALEMKGFEHMEDVYKQDLWNKSPYQKDDVVYLHDKRQYVTILDVGFFERGQEFPLEYECRMEDGITDWIKGHRLFKSMHDALEADRKDDLRPEYDLKSLKPVPPKIQRLRREAARHVRETPRYSPEEIAQRRHDRIKHAAWKKWDAAGQPDDWSRSGEFWAAAEAEEVEREKRRAIFAGPLMEPALPDYPHVD